MNPNLKGRDMRKAFDTTDYQVMIVANKFQTGFDQPKLCAMYVDKKLGGVDAVQTLSRLNRTYPNKDVVFVLDFVNQAEDIKQAFEPYYSTASLTGVTDPNDIFELQLKLDSQGIYTQHEVDQFAHAYFDPKGTQAGMTSAIKPSADRFKTRYKQALEEISHAQNALMYANKNGLETEIHNAERQLSDAGEQKDALDLFKKDLTNFVHMYEFLSQIVDYEDAELEKRSVFIRGLLPNIKTIDLAPPIDLGNIEMTHFKIKNQQLHSIALGAGEIHPDGTGGGKARNPKEERLEQIIHKLNELFAGALTESDRLNYTQTIKDKILEHPHIMAQICSNTKEQALLGDFPEVMTDAVIESMEVHHAIATQILSQPDVRKRFEQIVLNMIYEERNVV